MDKQYTETTSISQTTTTGYWTKPRTQEYPDARLTVLIKHENDYESQENNPPLWIGCLIMFNMMIALLGIIALVFVLSYPF